MKKVIKKRNDKVILLVVIVATFLFVCFNVYHYFNTYNKNTGYNNIKEDTSKLIVYTRYTRDVSDIVTMVPYINLKTDIIGDLNNQIAEVANSYLVNEDNVLTYEYQISGDILSVVMQINCYDQPLPVVYFKTYNINLKEKRILEDADILSLFNITEADVSQKIEEKFKTFFREEREKNIFDEECDYTCFLGYRNISNYLDNIHYYVDNAQLYVYKEFNIYSIYDEEDYFKNTDYKMAITE